MENFKAQRILETYNGENGTVVLQNFTALYNGSIFRGFNKFVDDEYLSKLIVYIIVNQPLSYIFFYFINSHNKFRAWIRENPRVDEYELYRIHKYIKFKSVTRRGCTIQRVINTLNGITALYSKTNFIIQSYHTILCICNKCKRIIPSPPKTKRRTSCECSEMISRFFSIRLDIP